MAKSKTRCKMPSRAAIAEYWSPRVEQFGVYNYSQDELPDCECWACGKLGLLQRCHIDDHAHGGENAVENLVILCPGCHAESESLSLASFWPWIRHSRQTRWKTPWEHVMRKLEAAGYSLSVLQKMVHDHGFEETLRIVTADVYHEHSIDRTLAKQSLQLTNEAIEAKP